MPPCLYNADPVETGHQVRVPFADSTPLADEILKKSSDFPVRSKVLTRLQRVQIHLSGGECGRGGWDILTGQTRPRLRIEGPTVGDLNVDGRHLLAAKLQDFLCSQAAEFPSSD